MISNHAQHTYNAQWASISKNWLKVYVRSSILSHEQADAIARVDCEDNSSRPKLKIPFRESVLKRNIFGTKEAETLSLSTLSFLYRSMHMVERAQCVAPRAHQFTLPAHGNCMHFVGYTWNVLVRHWKHFSRVQKTTSQIRYSSSLPFDRKAGYPIVRGDA